MDIAIASTSNDETGWTESRIEKLKAMHAERLSASIIARALGGGLTRNAVIGKIHRLKLPTFGRRPAQPRVRATSDRPKRIGGFAGAALARARKARSVAVEDLGESQPMPDIIVDADIVGIPLIALTDKTCRWPLGDPRETGFRFCGCEPVEGKRYCPTHDLRSVQRGT